MVNVTSRSVSWWVQLYHILFRYLYPDVSCHVSWWLPLYPTLIFYLYSDCYSCILSCLAICILADTTTVYSDMYTELYSCILLCYLYPVTAVSCPVSWCPNVLRVSWLLQLYPVLLVSTPIPSPVTHPVSWWILPYLALYPGQEEVPLWFRPGAVVGSFYGLSCAVPTPWGPEEGQWRGERGGGVWQTMYIFIITYRHEHSLIVPQNNSSFSFCLFHRKSLFFLASCLKWQSAFATYDSITTNIAFLSSIPFSLSLSKSSFQLTSLQYWKYSSF